MAGSSRQIPVLLELVKEWGCLVVQLPKPQPSHHLLLAAWWAGQLAVLQLLAAVVQRYHFELTPGQRVQLQPAITLRAKNGILGVVKERQ